MTGIDAVTTSPLTLAAGGLNGWLIDLFFRKEGASLNTGKTDDLFMFIWWVSFFSFVILMGMMLYFVWKYRRRPGVAALRSASHNTPLELTWSIVPLLLMVPMFFLGFHGYIEAVVAPGDAEEIRVEARKWSWNMVYGNGAASPIREYLSAPSTVDQASGSGAGPGRKHLGGGTPQPVFVVPAGRPIRLRMHSQDVLHSFWVPDFRMKFDVFPNRYTSFWFETRPEDLGDHWIFCAEYCGDQHSEMLGILRVVSPADYARTIQTWATPTGSPEEIGAFLYKTKGCVACHSIDGSRNVGPTWLNVYGYEQEFSNSPPVIADENYLRESILVPSAKVSAGFPNQMVSYQGQLTDTELEALISYIRSLSDRAPPKAPAPEGEEGAGAPPPAEPAPAPPEPAPTPEPPSETPGAH